MLPSFRARRVLSTPLAARGKNQSVPLPVSVIIPCYNDGATVGNAVESARVQNPAEIVIVNDGSTDPLTQHVLSTLSQAGAHVIDQPNAGLALARMRGVQETSAPYIMALDADDEIAPGALARMAAALDKDPALDVVWGDIERFGAAGHKIHPKAKILDPWRITYVNELVASTLIRRASLLEAGGWSLREPYEDWDLWMSMAERGMRGRHIGGVTLRYRVDEPRMYRAATKRHTALVNLLRERHQSLYDARDVTIRTASASPLLKLVWRAAEILPVRAQRHAFFAALIVCEPARRRRRV